MEEVEISMNCCASASADNLTKKCTEMFQE